MFTISYREEIRENIISRAKEDKRIVSAAVVGSYARGETDRGSDIDLTFGVNEYYSVKEVLNSFTNLIFEEFSGKVLFDIQVGSTIYRVFILPGCLQVDLSFSPEKEFGAMGKHFQLLYGKKYEKTIKAKTQPTREIFGWMVHHLLRARFCAERNRLWQAEFWLSEARNYALKLACISRGLSSDYGRGFDDLPKELLSPFSNSFVIILSKDEILRALRVIIEQLPNISEEINQITEEFNKQLKDLVSQFSVDFER